MVKKESLLGMVIVGFVALGIAYLLRKPERRDYLKESAKWNVKKIKRRVKRKPNDKDVA